MRWLMLPVSIGSHVIAAMALLIVPLAAEVAPPAPAPLRQVLITKLTPVPAAAVALTHPRRASSATSFITPPALAPERSHPDTDVTPVDAPPFAGERVEPGLPDGVGFQMPLPGSRMVPARPPAAPVPQRAGQGVREPRKIVDVAPIYPEIARLAKVQGAVILEAVIDESGAVDRIRVLRSSPLLDAAAIDAVSRWRYTPTLLNGTPVAVLMTITINFTLNP
jgi:protein TonB